MKQMIDNMHCYIIKHRRININ